VITIRSPLLIVLLDVTVVNMAPLLGGLLPADGAAR
jgi:hypothetical protein